MAQVDTVDSDKRTDKKRTFKLIDAIGGLVRAGTEAATEVSVGTVRVVADTFTGVAQSVADNVNTTVSNSIDVAQRGADRFLSVLDSSRKAAESVSKEDSAAARESSARRQVIQDELDATEREAARHASAAHKKPA